MIAIADTGDNESKRDGAEILLLPEPKRLADVTVRPARVLRFRYPGGPRDAEALLADPRNGRLYVADKTLFGSILYAVPESRWPRRTKGFSQFTMQRVAEVDADLITDGTFLPDGRMLLRGYGSVSLLPPPEKAAGGKLAALAVRRLPFQDQGESITLTADATQALIGSEGRREPVLRVPIPVAGTDPTTEFGDSPTPSPTARAVAGTNRASEVGGAGQKVTLGIGGMFAVLAGGALYLLRRH